MGGAYGVVAIGDPVKGNGAKVTDSGSLVTEVGNTVTTSPAESDTINEDSVDIGNSAADLVAANSSRLTVEIWNHDATHAVHITLSSGTPDSDSPKIGPGGGWQLPGGAKYTGAIRAVCPTASGSNTIKVVYREYVS